MYSRVGLIDQSRGYIWDSTTLTWVASPAPSSAAGSTTVNISSLAVSTGFVKNAGLAVNSSNELLTVGGTGSTQVAISSGIVQTQPISSSGVSMSTDTAPASTKQGLIVRQVGFTIDSSGALQVNTGPGGSTQVAISSGIVQTQPISSSGVSMSTDTDPASTKQGLIVRQVGFSTIFAVSSLAGAVIVRSSAADFNATISGNVGQASTVWAIQADGRIRAQNSTIGDLLASVQQNSTVWAAQVDGRVRAQNSTIADLLAQVAQNSTVWVTQAHFMDSSNVVPNVVGTRPTTSAQALSVRGVLNDLQSTVNSTAGNTSTSSTIVSSVASQRIKVYAYSVTSTAQGNSSLSFRSSGAAQYIWGIDFRALSSAMGGANLAVTPPAWLFATDAGAALTFGTQGATGTFVVSVSYFVEA